MADIKVYNGKVNFSSDGLEISNQDEIFPEEKTTLDHDETDASEDVGKGSTVRDHTDPTILEDDGYIDLPDDTSGRGFVIFDDAGTPYWADFDWTRYASVQLIDGSGSPDVYNIDTPNAFCIFDNGDNVRIKNTRGKAVRVVLDAQYTADIISPTFRVFNSLSGVDNLDPNLTINGTTVTPTFRYKGGDANSVDWEPWTYGDTLSISAGTAPSYNQGSPGLGPNDDSVLFNTGARYEGSGDTGYFTTGDLVIETVLQYSTNSNEYTFGNWNTSTSRGWLFYNTTGGGYLRFFMDDTSGTAFVTSGANLVDGAWYHIMVFVNRDENSANSCSIYVNGVQDGTGNLSSMSGSMASDDFAIGGRSGGSNEYSKAVAYVAGWESASWHQAGASGPAEWATIAKERFQKLTGIYPEIANGTYTPNTASRAHEAYIDKEEAGYQKLYYVGDNWLRMCHRIDSNNVSVKGYLAEPAIENKIVESENFSTWTKSVAGDTVTDNAVECPDGRTVAASLAADSTDTTHAYSTTATLTAATYTISFFIKAGNKSWVNLWCDGAFPDCYFDVSNGVVGTATNCTGYIEGPFYNDFYRCCIVFTATARTYIIRLYTADADGDRIVSDGDGSINLYVWGAQCEQSNYMTSPIISTTATSPVTRAKDELQYVAGDNIGGENITAFSVFADILFPFYTPVQKSFFAISDGGVATDYVFPYFATTSGKLSFVSAADAGSAGAGDVTGSFFDNTKHVAGVNIETDNLYVSRDGTAGTADTSATIPDAKDRLDLGQDNNGGGQTSGLISNFRVYNVTDAE